MKMMGRWLAALCPVAGLLVASVAGGKTIYAYMDVNGGFPDGTRFINCATEDLIFAEAHGFDSNGKEVCMASINHVGSGESDQQTCPSSAVDHEAMIHDLRNAYVNWGGPSNTNNVPGWVSTGAPNFYNTSFAFYNQPVRVASDTSTCLSGVSPRAWSFGQ